LLFWDGYGHRKLWFCFLGKWLANICRYRVYWRQLLVVGPLIVIWLLFCHWVNTHGWHGIAASGIFIAMMLGLNAMRQIEEQQKWEKEQCDTLE